MNVTPAHREPPRSVPDLPFYDPVVDDFAAMNAFIPRQLTSDVTMVEEIGHHIVESGGKRLRPLLVLLTARCLGVTDSRPITLAAIIEFLHTATLLHDDVVDRSDLRRGRATANHLWGNAPSVLVGDFLYSRAFQMMVSLGDMDIMQVLSDATNVIAEGEVMQLDGIGKVDMDEPRYLEVIRCKTAMLFQAAAHTATLLPPREAGRIRAMRGFGLEVGIAFQLIDDALDYSGDTATLGKNVGDDLAEGKITLPLIHTMRAGTVNQAETVRNAVRNRDATRFEEVCCAVQAAGAIDYTLQRAREASMQALAALAPMPRNRYRQALEQLAHFAAARSY